MLKRDCLFRSKSLLAIILAAAVSLSPLAGAVPVFAAQGTEAQAEVLSETADNSIQISSEAGIVMDADTGVILYEKNGDTQMYPASVTKIMTTLLALELGNPEDIVTMTQTGVNYSISGSSNLNTQVGEQFVLKDMLYGVMLKSANDISTQVGEHLGGGSLDTFLQMMNNRAVELGCTNTNFHNVCGMPDPEHVTTAHDLALIGKACIAREDFREIIGTHSYEIPATNMSPARTVTNHVAMLVSPEYQYPGILGGKTGLTDAAGSCLITFDEQNGRTLICVTLKATDGGIAVQDHTNLYNYTLENYENISLWDNQEDILAGGIASVPKGITKNDLEETETEGEDENGNETVTLSYSYGGKNVGSVTVLKNAERVTPVSDGESSVSSVETSGVSVPETENTSPDLLAEFAEMSVYRKGIIILTAVILLGIILIIGTVVKHRKENKTETKQEEKE